MTYYLRFGKKYIKRSRNRRLPPVEGLTGTKKMAKIYTSLRDARKAVTTYSYMYPAFKDNLEIQEVNPSKKKNTAEEKED